MIRSFFSISTSVVTFAWAGCDSVLSDIPVLLILTLEAAAVNISFVPVSCKSADGRMKRLSFLLGPDSKIHTPTSQLIKKGKILDYNDLYNRFDIEVVSEQFFLDYKILYKYLSKYLDEDKIFSRFARKINLDTNFFARKLLGQITFCYFLQKKGWLGVPKDKNFGKGDLSFLRNKFEEYKIKDKNFFNDFLEHFFYEGLNKKNDNFYNEKISCKIPYIGGGLFEYYDGYDWKNEVLNIPNKTFSNKQNTGILDIFDLYNFTVDENLSVDVDLAVDPEMLGKVFENLLPENIKHEEAPFYTPRSVVKYMCEQSLKRSIENKFENIISEAQINDLVENENFQIENNGEIKINAKELGYTIKLLAIVENFNNGILARVHPSMINIATPLAKISGAMNAIEIKADMLGELIIQGPGAGARVGVRGHGLGWESRRLPVPGAHGS